MRKTAFQKIVDSHLVETLPDGSMVLWLDRIWGHEITTPNAILDAQVRGVDVVFDPNKVKMMIDHVNPANDTASAIQGKIVREWSAKHDIEFLDVGRNGICHAIIPEKGWILPGEIGIMGDSHTCTHGAFCAFTAGVGTTELEIGIITGLWICSPQKVIRVNFIGKLPANVFAKDLILALIVKIGVKGATNAVLEFGGNIIDDMSMDGRMTITNMAVEAGATSGMMMVDGKTIDYLEPALTRKYGRTLNFGDAREMMSVNSDPDAEYDQVIEMDVSNMTPLITNNYSLADVVPVTELAGKKVNQVYIGSCTNGRIEDLRIAANIFSRYGKVNKDTRCIVVPATPHIYEMALEEGLFKIFMKAGCFVSGPTCGACLGMSCGVLAPGEVCVSTTNRNFHGRMGEGGMVHLVSPATAALIAIYGKIMEPTEKDCRAAKFFSSQYPIKLKYAQAQEIQLTEHKDVSFETPNYSDLLARVSGGGSSKDFSGDVFYLPVDNVDTDQIIPAKYLTETKKEEFGKHCLEAAPIPAENRYKLHKSQILVAGENFGCGSSREHAPWALEAAGIKCVIASSFARIFENNMFANGLLCITLQKEDIGLLMKMKPETISVNLEKYSFGFLDGSNEGHGGTTIFFSISDHQKDLIKNGGALGVMLKIAAEQQEKEKKETEEDIRNTPF